MPVIPALAKNLIAVIKSRLPITAGGVRLSRLRHGEFRRAEHFLNWSVRPKRQVVKSDYMRADNSSRYMHLVAGFKTVWSRRRIR